MNILQEISQEYGKLYVSSFTEWSQTEDGLIGVTSQTKNGVCAAYCLYWLKSLNEGITTLPDFKTKIAAINTQLEFYKEDWIKIFEKKGVEIDGTKVKVDWLKSGELEFKTKTASKTIEKTVGEIDTSMVIQLCLSDNTSHLIALCSVDDKVSLFDPNYGVAVFNRAFLYEFFENYLEGFNNEFQKKLMKIKTYQTDGEFNLRPLFT